MKFFNARRSAYHTNPKLIDEVIYTPYIYDPQEAPVLQPEPVTATGDLLGIPELRDDEDDERTITTKKKKNKSKFDTTATEAEIFLFDYGTVIIWGMTEAQEKRFLTSM